jgi:hypothetical protein
MTWRAKSARPYRREPAGARTSLVRCPAPRCARLVIGPGGCCPPRHLTRVGQSFLEVNPVSEGPMGGTIPCVLALPGQSLGGATLQLSNRYSPAPYHGLGAHVNRKQNLKAVYHFCIILVDVSVRDYFYRRHRRLRKTSDDYTTTTAWRELIPGGFNTGCNLHHPTTHCRHPWSTGGFASRSRIARRIAPGSRDTEDKRLTDIGARLTSMINAHSTRGIGPSNQCRWSACSQ